MVHIYVTLPEQDRENTKVKRSWYDFFTSMKEVEKQDLGLKSQTPFKSQSFVDMDHYEVCQFFFTPSNTRWDNEHYKDLTLTLQVLTNLL